MKSTTRLLSLLAIALIAGAASSARAGENCAYPAQANIETRQIHTWHSLRNMTQPVVLEETIAQPVLFATASDKLTPTAAEQVRKVATLLKTPAYKGHHVLISGYTDHVGKEASNQRLSYHRAVTVVKQLERDGVPASMLTAQGFGEESPVADNSTSEGRALNRRVTFTLADWH